MSFQLQNNSLFFMYLQSFVKVKNSNTSKKKKILRYEFRDRND